MLKSLENPPYLSIVNLPSGKWAVVLLCWVDAEGDYFVLRTSKRRHTTKEFAKQEADEWAKSAGMGVR